MSDFQFPNWTNKAVVVVLIAVGVIGGYVATIGFLATHPLVINVGHQPEQPIPFSHKTHAGELKLDCRYCHNTVDKAATAAIPPSATCGNCHGGNRVPGLMGNAELTLAAVHLDSEKLAPLRESLETNRPVDWLRVHELPDFVYFNHSAHVNRGVSCVECHGRIDKMEVVSQKKPLSMKWCLDCHRNPELSLRPVDLVTKLDWNPETQEELAYEYGRVAEGGFESLKKYLDKNHSGDVEVDELSHLFAKPKTIDDNRDGKINVEELQTFGKKATRLDLGKLLRAVKNINPNTSCSTCHR